MELINSILFFAESKNAWLIFLLYLLSKHYSNGDISKLFSYISKLIQYLMRKFDEASTLPEEYQCEKKQRKQLMICSALAFMSNTMVFIYMLVLGIFTALQLVLILLTQEGPVTPLQSILMPCIAYVFARIIRLFYVLAIKERIGYMEVRNQGV